MTRTSSHILRLSICMLGFAWLAATSCSRASAPNWSDEEKHQQRLAAETLLNSMQDAINRGDKSFAVAPGNYRFDSQLGRGVDLIQVSNLNIEATGATFWFDGQYGIRFKQCQNVTLRGLVFDMDPLPWMQGRITTIRPENKSMEIVADSGNEPPAAELLKSGRRLLYYDPQTGHEIYSRDTFINRAVEIGDGRWRLMGFNNDDVFHGASLPRPLQPGDRIALLKGGSSNISINRCSGMTLEDVTVYASSGFVFHETGGHGGNHYLRCRIIRRPETDRLIASASDAFHSTAVRKGPLVEQCEFSYAADDLIAIHGFFYLTLAASKGATILVATPYAVDLVPGSTLRFFQLPNGKSIDEATIQEATQVEESTLVTEAKNLPQKVRAQYGIALRSLPGAVVYRVTLNRELALPAAALVADASLCGSGGVVRNNFLHDGHVRGVLAKTENLLIEGNRIERTAYAGIDLEPELYWLEGPFEKNVRVLKNSVKECRWGSFAIEQVRPTGGAITVMNSFGKTLSPELQNSQIELSGNKVTASAGFGIFVANTSGIKITDNEITAPFSAIHDKSHLNLRNQISNDWPLNETDQSNLLTPYYAVYALATDNIQSDGNHAVQAPDWMIGTFGFGPAAIPYPGSHSSEKDAR